MSEKNHCGVCEYFIRFYCPKFGKQVSYSGRVCDEYKYGDFEEVREEYRQKFNRELG